MTRMDPTTQHEEVVTSLLDLQRQLRGDDSAAGEVRPPMATSDLMKAPVALGSEEMSVAENDLRVLMTPPREPGYASEDERLGFAPVTQLPTAASGPSDDRLLAMSERLGRLEDDLSGVLGAIEEIRSDSVSTVQVEQRLVQEVASTRTDLQRSLEEGFARLQESMARAQGAESAETVEED